MDLDSSPSAEELRRKTVPLQPLNAWSSRLILLGRRKLAPWDGVGIFGAGLLGLSVALTRPTNLYTTGDCKSINSTTQEDGTLQTVLRI
jgi:hypothetical protein